MKRIFLFICFLFVFSQLCSQFLEVYPDSLFINIDPEEMDWFMVMIGNLTANTIEMTFDVNYLSDRMDRLPTNYTDDNWIGIDPNCVIQIPGYSLVSCCIPVYSHGFAGITKTAELVIIPSMGDNSVIPVTMEVNPLPGCNPPQDLFVDQFGYASWNPPIASTSRDLMGYNIYLDGCLICCIGDCYFQFEYLIPEQTYTVGISAVYDEGESDLVYFTFIYNPTLNSVQNLFITEMGYATWNAPTGTEGSREFLGYNVYLNEDFLTFTTDEFYDYEQNGLNPGSLYVGGITAIYDEGESTTEWQPFTYLPEPFYPPENIIYNELTGFITWDAPTSSYNIEGFLIYLDNLTNPIGTTTNTCWEVTDLIAGQTYVFGLQTVYDVGESDIITITFCPVNTDNRLLAQTYHLSNYPNPFNPSTTISLDLTTQDAKNAKIEIYNIKGQKIKTLECCNSFAAASKELSYSQTAVWNGNDEQGQPVASGVYYYRLNINGKTVDTKSCLLLK